MNAQFGAPNVCLIDDEADDYEPMLDALLRQGIGAVHVRGTDLDSTPPEPFRGLRLVLTDLHLGSSSSQKDHASHTAAVFKRTVSPEHGPVLVVVWSKFADEPVPSSEFASPPGDDQPDLADLFVEELIQADPRFKDVAVFLRMIKPHKADRDMDRWVGELQVEINRLLDQFPGVGFLSEWESLVRCSCMSVADELIGMTGLSEEGDQDSDQGFDQSMKEVLKLLAREQGGSGVTHQTAGTHLSAVMSQLLSDQLERSLTTFMFTTKLNWISESPPSQIPPSVKARINASLLATGTDTGVPAFFPGTVYCVTDAAAFCAAFGASLDDLYLDFHKKLTATDRAMPASWQSKITPVLIELSAMCDFHQGKRRKAALVAGIAVPADAKIERSDFRMQLPVMLNAWGSHECIKSDEFFLVFSNYFKVTIPVADEPSWLKRWFRLRELPAASVRNWHAGHASRVGYLSLR